MKIKHLTKRLPAGPFMNLLYMQIFVQLSALIDGKFFDVKAFAICLLVWFLFEVVSLLHEIAETLKGKTITQVRTFWVRKEEN